MPRAGYRLTNKAENRIAAIFEYSTLTFGIGTARDYVADLHHVFGLIAQHPALGRDVGFIRPGIRRHEHGSHSIYYRPIKRGVLIVDILGSRQDPGRHL